MLYLVIAALVVAADQLTKALARGGLEGLGEITTIPGVLHLSLSRNYGASLGMLGGQRWLLAVLSAAAAVLIVYLIVRKKMSSRLEYLGLAFVLGGAVGNLIDRVAAGDVTDMIIFPWIGKIPLMPDFICNVADIFITFGAVIFVAAYLVCELRREHAAKTGGVSRESRETGDAEEDS